MNEAALEAYKDALRSKKREPELLNEARYERAKLYLATGKKAQGRKELEKVYAEDAGFRDVAELLRQDLRRTRAPVRRTGGPSPGTHRRPRKPPISRWR